MRVFIVIRSDLEYEQRLDRVFSTSERASARVREVESEAGSPKAWIEERDVDSDDSDE